MVFRVKYKLDGYCNKEKAIDVVAKSKAEAYDKAVFEAIPAKDATTPYSAWVSSVTYQNGNYKRFNTWEGKPY